MIILMFIHVFLSICLQMLMKCLLIKVPSSLLLLFFLRVMVKREGLWSKVCNTILTNLIAQYLLLGV